MTRELSLDVLAADARASLAAALADCTAPGYVTVRALVALGDERDDRVARFTAMGRQFVTDVRRRVRQAGVDALLNDVPSVDERVLDTAARQVAERGGDGLTMQAVAAEARIPRRTLYNLYSGSGELVGACCRRAQTIWRARFEQRVRSAQPEAKQRLFAVVEAIDAWVASDRFRPDQALCARPAFAGALRDDDFREHLAEIDRFATLLAVDALVTVPGAFGAFTATSIAGAAAWFDRREAARAASVAFIERLMEGSH